MGALAPLELEGSPAELERMLRRGARWAQLLLALPPTLLLWWLGAWYWLPLPLAASFVLYELLFWWRGDAPLSLQLGEDGLRLLDSWKEAPLALDWSEVTLAKAFWRRTPEGAEVTTLLASERGPLFALRFLLLRDAAPEPGDVDLDAADALLGGQGGVIRSVAPVERVARQRFEDPRGLVYLRSRLPPEVWKRTGLRLWTGLAPALDPFGYHADEPSGWLLLEGRRWALHVPGTGEIAQRGNLASLALFSASRTVRMVSLSGPVEAEVPLLGLDLGGLRVWFPAPQAGPGLPPAELAPTDHHTHPPEGAALLWHLRAELPRERWPETLVGMVERHD